MKVLIKNKGGAAITANIDKNTQLYPHFKLWELANNKGSDKEPQYIITPDNDLFMMLIEDFRVKINRPMNCNSCFRQAAYNKAVGGSVNSLHLLGEAFDWGVDLTAAERNKYIKIWQEITQKACRVGGINLYQWGLHLDASEHRFGYKSFVVRNYL